MPADQAEFSTTKERSWRHTYLSVDLGCSLRQNCHSRRRVHHDSVEIKIRTKMWKSCTRREGCGNFGGAENWWGNLKETERWWRWGRWEEDGDGRMVETMRERSGRRSEQLTDCHLDASGGVEVWLGFRVTCNICLCGLATRRPSACRTPALHLQYTKMVI